MYNCALSRKQQQQDSSAVAVAQLVESRIVIPVVVGSSPISHPRFHEKSRAQCPAFFMRARFALVWRYFDAGAAGAAGAEAASLAVAGKALGRISTLKRLFSAL